MARDVQAEFNRLQRQVAAYAKAVPGGAKQATRTAMQYFLESAATQTPRAPSKRPIYHEGRDFIVYPYIRNTHKRAKRIFHKESTAKRYARIDTRGLCKAGWWGSGAAVGKPMKKPAGKLVPPLVQRVASMIVDAKPDKASFTAVNRAPGMDRYARMVLPYALGRASNRLGAATRAELAKAKTFAFK